MEPHSWNVHGHGHERNAVANDEIKNDHCAVKNEEETQPNNDGQGRNVDDYAVQSTRDNALDVVKRNYDDVIKDIQGDQASHAHQQAASTKTEWYKIDGYEKVDPFGTLEEALNTFFNTPELRNMEVVKTGIMHKLHGDPVAPAGSDKYPNPEMVVCNLHGHWSCTRHREYINKFLSTPSKNNQNKTYGKLLFDACGVLSEVAKGLKLVFDVKYQIRDFDANNSWGRRYRTYRDGLLVSLVHAIVKGGRASMKDNGKGKTIETGLMAYIKPNCPLTLLVILPLLEYGQQILPLNWNWNKLTKINNKPSKFIEQCRRQQKEYIFTYQYLHKVAYGNLDAENRYKKYQFSEGCFGPVHRIMNFTFEHYLSDNMTYDKGPKQMRFRVDNSERNVYNDEYIKEPGAHIAYSLKVGGDKTSPVLLNGTFVGNWKENP